VNSFLKYCYIVLVVRLTLSFSRDSNSNGIVSYRLQQDSFLFSIDHYSGEIRLKNRPERYLSMNALDIIYHWKI
jgi:hypothetical protein